MNQENILPDETVSTSSSTALERYSLLRAWVTHQDVSFHSFTDDEAHQIRERLLTWYRIHRRKLPWRGDPPPWQGSTANFGHVSKRRDPVETSEETDEALKRTYPVTPYGVWVSEIMLQQTRVEAVVAKWCAWMTAFPTVHDLAAATPEQVNAHWAGLGFYRRARLLHTAAKQVVDELDGTWPDNTVAAWVQLPGVGRYTASAICSIVYNVSVPVVDGNVCRVLSRLRGISQTIKAPILKDRHGWDLAGQLVGAAGSSAGEINQALMELGATYCAPSGTGTDAADPLRDLYYSVQLGTEFADYCQQGGTVDHLVDLHASNTHSCPLCSSSGVTETLAFLNQFVVQAASSKEGTTFGHAVFPLPPPKVHKREDVWAVAAISRGDTWLLVKRPDDGGLLAGQWEFPAALVWSSESSDDKAKKAKRKDMSQQVPMVATVARRKALRNRLTELAAESVSGIRLDSVGDTPIEHVFSHVRYTMWVDHAAVNDTFVVDTSHELAQWMNAAALDKVGVTSGVKKILKAVLEERQTSSNTTADDKPKRKTSNGTTKKTTESNSPAVSTKLSVTRKRRR